MGTCRALASSCLRSFSAVCLRLKDRLRRSLARSGGPRLHLPQRGKLKPPPLHTSTAAIASSYDLTAAFARVQFTQALSLSAIRDIFRWLPASYTSKDPEPRERMHHAAAIAGFALANAFVGVNHSLAHQLGGEWADKTRDAFDRLIMIGAQRSSTSRTAPPLAC